MKNYVLTINLGEDLYNKVSDLAVKENLGVENKSQAIRFILRQYFNNQR